MDILTIRVVNDRAGLPLPHGHAERREHQVSPQMRRHRPAHDPATPDVEHHGQVEEAAPGGHVGDVGHPERIRAGRGERPLDQIRRRPPGPERRCRGFNNLRALAQNRGETGSLETAPSATQSPRCSHSGIVQGQAWGFPGISGEFRRRGARSRDKAGGAGARRGAVSQRSSREPIFVVRVVHAETPLLRQADGGSDLRPAECCRPGESARGMDPSYIPRLSLMRDRLRTNLSTKLDQARRISPTQASFLGQCRSPAFQARLAVIPCPPRVR